MTAKVDLNFFLIIILFKFGLAKAVASPHHNADTISFRGDLVFPEVTSLVNNLKIQDERAKLTELLKGFPLIHLSTNYKDVRGTLEAAYGDLMNTTSKSLGLPPAYLRIFVDNDPKVEKILESIRSQTHDIQLPSFCSHIIFQIIQRPTNASAVLLNLLQKFSSHISQPSLRLGVSLGSLEEVDHSHVPLSQVSPELVSTTTSFTVSFGTAAPILSYSLFEKIMGHQILALCQKLESSQNQKELIYIILLKREFKRIFSSDPEAYPRYIQTITRIYSEFSQTRNITIIIKDVPDLNDLELISNSLLQNSTYLNKLRNNFDQNGVLLNPNVIKQFSFTKANDPLEDPALNFTYFTLGKKYSSVLLIHPWQPSTFKTDIVRQCNLIQGSGIQSLLLQLLSNTPAQFDFILVELAKSQTCVTGIVINMDDLVIYLYRRKKRFPGEMISADFRGLLDAANLSLYTIAPGLSPSSKTLFYDSSTITEEVEQLVMEVAENVTDYLGSSIHYDINRFRGKSVFDSTTRFIQTLTSFYESYKTMRKKYKTKILFFTGVIWDHNKYPEKCDLQEVTPVEHMDIIQAWAYIHGWKHVNLVAFTASDEDSVEYGRWTYLRYADRIFSDADSRPCTKWDQKGFKEPVIFTHARKVAGISLNFGNVSDELEKTLFVNGMRFAMLKFNKTEIDINLAHEISLLLEIPEKRNSSEIYLLANNFSELANKRLPLDFVSGVHFRSASLLEETEVPPGVIQMLKTTNVSVGLLYENCLIAAGSKFRMVTEKEISFFKISNYVICDIPGLNRKHDSFVKGLVNYGDMMELIDAARSLRWYLHKVLNLKIQVMLRIGWLKSGNDTTIQNQDTEEYLKFVKLINDLCASYELPYFLRNAFEGEIFENDEDSLKRRFHGWWWVNGTATSGRVSLQDFVEKEAEILGLEMSRPMETVTVWEAEIKEDLVWLWPTIAGLVSALIIISSIFFGCLRKARNVLSEAEYKAFREGTFDPELEVEKKAEYVGLNMKYSREFEINRDDLDIDKEHVLGSGTFGSVYQATHLPENSQVAVKAPVKKDKQCLISFLSEIKVMSYVGQHTNILKFVGAYTGNIRKGYVLIVTELCEKGSLETWLRDQSSSKEPVELYVLAKFCWEIASGMEFIGGKKVVHGDLSARNILLDAFGTCKISDFGLAKKLYEYDIYVKTKGELMPWRWLAPESLERMEFTLKSDVWSFGVTCWEIFTLGRIPYPELHWSHDFLSRVQGGLRLPQPELAPDQVFAMMKKCWYMDPASRIQFKELHLYFKELCQNEYVSV